ncbi:glycosyltransferase family 4 protein [Thalassospira lucentensis]|uniref:glycosyltransferase family 4 protein n=1 Tax=Thalassospira lucentensis TaxID=168935 RepID=UPI00142D392B|nr:glycosyltransferase family 4 protein [Thalassospira lucentensis]NIZ00165.1 glycosyltransferase family 4 protein [Thalassospira lucentensis]
MAVYKKLANRQHKITILTWSKGEDKKYVDKFPDFDIKVNDTYLPNRVWMIYQILFLKKDASQSDMVILSNQLFGSYIAAIFASIRRIPFLLRFGYLNSLQDAHNYGKLSKKYLFSYINEFFSMRLASKIITTTTTISSAVKSLNKSLTSKLHVLPNYVDSSTFFPISSDNLIRIKTQPHADKFQIVTTARLSYPKRHDLIIEAISKLSNVKLICVGDGPDKENLQNLSSQLNTDVEFVGRVKNDELLHIYHNSHVFVLFSDYEGHPKSLIEAMACRIAVVGSNVIGISDVLEDQHTGLLTGLNATELAEALEKLQLDEKLRLSLADNAYDHAKSYHLDNYVEQIENILQQTAIQYAR